jgi:diadenosine tetraphosphatase ApaH/serine/threonine PP2A family protein phosphatase
MADVVDFVLSGFQEILGITGLAATAIGSTQPLPRFSSQTVVDLCRQAAAAFKALPIVLRPEMPMNVVGDIHGNFRDLIRVLQSQGLTANYLFLGDYVDRGPFSLECVLLLFALALKWPDRFLLIRGNHEFADIAGTYGFRDEILGVYDELVFDEFMVAFSYLPLAAVISSTVFCVHGGIGPELNQISQIDTVERPITDITKMPMVTSMLWADPTTDTPRFHKSLRSETQEYGPIALHQFLQGNNLTLLLRGHQVVNGVQKLSGMSVITVFSSSCSDIGRANQAAIVQLMPKEPPQAAYFAPLPRFNRDEAAFFDVMPAGSIIAPTRTSLARGKFGAARSSSLGGLASGMFRAHSYRKRSGFFRRVTSQDTFTSGTDDQDDTIPVSDDQISG